MKTIKYFCLSALALTLAACSNDDNEVTQQPAEQVQGIPFTATISIGQSGSNRALAEDGTKLVATWAVGEKVALIHNGVNDEMEVASVSGGVATISGTITGSPSTGDAVTIIYPSTAANGATGNVKASLLKQQEGTLEAVSAKYDVRKGTGTLKVDGVATLSDNVSLTNQFAIWKLTIPTSKNLCIFAGSEPIVGATLASEGAVFYVAVPAFSDQTVNIYSSDASNNCYHYTRSGVSLTAGKYYQSTLTTEQMPKLGTSPASIYRLTGAGTIPNNCTAVLSGVNISGGYIACAGNAGIILLGNNSISPSIFNAAIEVGSGNTLTINGTGKLVAHGRDSSAGIGSNSDNPCGNICIYGGIIEAYGDNKGAGIGSGWTENCGNITITSGVIKVTAVKGAEAPYSIGKGYDKWGDYTCGTVTIGGVVTGQITTSPYIYQPQ